MKRLMGAPAKCDFLKNGMNIVDVLSILPFFIELFMNEEEIAVTVLKTFLENTVFELFLDTNHHPFPHVV